jgi:thioredoxin-related protein
MGLGSSSPQKMVDLAAARQLVKELIDSDSVVIFSKTTCPYCKSAKGVSFMKYQICIFYVDHHYVMVEL